LTRELTDLSRFYISNGTATTVDLDNGTMNMVLKILIDDSFAIQTYERVLYFLTMEVF
jgi:hypothetical protein